MNTNFQKTALFNQIGGNDANADWAALKRQADLIQSELNETYEAIEKRDVKELRDGIADILVTAYGLGHRAGVDADADYAAVHASNMSKFDRSEEDATLTQVKYQAIGVETDISCKVMMVGHEMHNSLTFRQDEQFFVVKSTKDQVGTDGKKYPVGKILKSHLYQDPVLPEIPGGLPHLPDMGQEMIQAAHTIGFSTRQNDVSLIVGPSEESLGYSCKITFHRTATTGNEPVTVDAQFEMFSTPAEYLAPEDISSDDIDEHIVTKIASLFFTQMCKVYPVMVFIDAVELLDEPASKWTCRWSNPKNIMHGLTWEKVA